MKKWFALLLVVALLPVCALAAPQSIDLSSMSYEELVELKDKINLAMWESEEWQEVSVPYGVYTVGEDIPEGHWTIKAETGGSLYIKWGDALDESGKDIGFGGKIYFSESVYSPEYKYYESGETTEVDIDAKAGQFIIVSDGIAVFTPYAGKQGLGFK